MTGCVPTSVREALSAWARREERAFAHPTSITHTQSCYFSNIGSIGTR
jgi:hypothetical protein